MPATQTLIVDGRGRRLLLRRLRTSDLEAMVRFAKELYKERLTNPDLGIVSIDSPVRVDEERRFIKRTVEGVRRRTVVSVAAFHEDRLVGNCDILRRKPKDVHHTGVLGIAIVEGYRGAGLGEALIREALKASESIGMWLIELTVFANNARAIHLYEKTGFRRVGIVPMKISRGGRLTDEIVMFAILNRK